MAAPSRAFWSNHEPAGASCWTIMPIHAPFACLEFSSYLTTLFAPLSAFDSSRPEAALRWRPACPPWIASCRSRPSGWSQSSFRGHPSTLRRDLCLIPWVWAPFAAWASPCSSYYNTNGGSPGPPTDPRPYSSKSLRVSDLTVWLVAWTVAPRSSLTRDSPTRTLSWSRCPPSLSSVAFILCSSRLFLCKLAAFWTRLPPRLDW